MCVACLQGELHHLLYVEVRCNVLLLNIFLVKVLCMLKNDLVRGCTQYLIRRMTFYISIHMQKEKNTRIMPLKISIKIIHRQKHGTDFLF